MIHLIRKFLSWFKRPRPVVMTYGGPLLAEADHQDGDTYIDLSTGQVYIYSDAEWNPFLLQLEPTEELGT